MTQNILDSEQVMRSVYDPVNQALKIGNSPCPAAEPLDASLGADELVFYRVTDALMVKVKYTDGVTVKTGTVVATLAV